MRPRERFELLFRVSLPILGLVASGCWDFGEAGDAKVPGEPLGTFEVTGKLSEDTCKATVLGVTNPWQFGVKLSRMSSDLYWLNGREAISGSIDSDRVSFSFDTRVDVSVEAPRGRSPGCVFERSDLARGRLSAATNDVESFTGTLKFSYAAKTTSDCSGWVGVEGGFGNLPCSVTYDLSGKRTQKPEQDK